MRRRITKALLATATAGATVIGLGLAAAGPASAAQVSRDANPSSAGWAAGNILTTSPMTGNSTWNFRYSSGTTTVPDVSESPLYENRTREVFSSQLSNNRGTFAAQLRYYSRVLCTSLGSSCPGAGWNIQFMGFWRSGASSHDYTLHSCNFHHIIPGDHVRLDVYYDQGNGSIQFTAYDNNVQLCQKYVSAWNSHTRFGGRFQEAYVGGVFAPKADAGNPYMDGLSAWNRPDSTDTLFDVSNTHFTSYNGTRGSVIGPWPYQSLWFGTSLYNLYATVSGLSNYGQNFSVSVQG